MAKSLQPAQVSLLGLIFVVTIVASWLGFVARKPTAAAGSICLVMLPLAALLLAEFGIRHKTYWLLWVAAWLLMVGPCGFTFIWSWLG